MKKLLLITVILSGQISAMVPRVAEVVRSEGGSLFSKITKPRSRNLSNEYGSGVSEDTFAALREKAEKEAAEVRSAKDLVLYRDPEKALVPVGEPQSKILFTELQTAPTSTETLLALPKNTLPSNVFDQVRNIELHYSNMLNAAPTVAAPTVAEANFFRDMFNKFNEYGQGAKNSIAGWLKKPSNNNTTTARNTFFDAKADQEVIKQGVPVEGQVQTTPQSKLLEIYGSLLGGAAGAGVGVGIMSQGLKDSQREALLPYGDFNSLPYEAGMIEKFADARNAYIQAAEQERLAAQQAQLAKIQAEEAARQAVIAAEQAKLQEALAQASWKNRMYNGAAYVGNAALYPWYAIKNRVYGQ